MTLQECTKLLAPLGVQLRTDLDGPTFRAYFRALEDVPIDLLTAAVIRAGTSCRFFPKASELRQFAEEARQAVLAAHPFGSCGVCSLQGWVTQEIDGVPRQVRCRCWQAHQQKIQALGIGSEPLALPAGVEAE